MLVSYWIRIDGINTNRVIQAGFDASKKADGTVEYTAFYEWFPNVQTLVSASDFTASSGDVVDITVRTFGHGTAATATFVNRNTRAPYTTPEFYSPDEDSDATGESAAWFVEQPPQLTLANFDQLIFSDCAAADKDEHRYGLTGGTEVNLVFRGTALAIGTIISDDQVGVNHIEQQEEQASEQAPEPEPEEPVIVCTEIDCSDIGGT